MKICSDVDGVILDNIQGFIDFTKRKKIAYSHDPELYGVIRNFPNNEEIRDQFHSGDDLRLLNYFDDSLKILNTLATEHELHIVTALEPEQAQKRTFNFDITRKCPLHRHILGKSFPTVHREYAWG